MRKSRLKTTPLVNPYVAIAATLPALLSIFVLAMLPAIINLAISFTDYHGVGQPFEFVGFENFVRVFQVQNAAVGVWDSLLNTLVFSVCVVLIQQPLSLGMALIVNRKFKGRSFFRALYFMPTILGVSVVGFTWQLMFDPVSGPIAALLSLFGTSSAFLGEEGLSMALVIIVAIWANFGYAMVIYIAGLSNISEDVREAAQLDGAGSFKLFWYVTLPLLKSTLAINFWISISGTLSMYDIIYVLTNGAHGTTTLALYIFKLATNSSSNQGQAAVLYIYFSVFVTVVMLIFNFLFRRKEKEAKA